MQKAMAQHNKHINTANLPKKHWAGYYFLEFAGGLIVALFLIYALSYSLARVAAWLLGYAAYGAIDDILFLVAAIYSIVFVKILTYGRDKQSDLWKWFGIGGLGLLLGLFIDWIVRKASTNNLNTKYGVFLIAWLITTFIAYAIFIVELPYA
ncbi:hypothetical protein M1367_05100 [Candidatus Marsarchaeota archaeon]|nr:hypothetical protein [Candidatus Marsarchaeota archaeon]